MLSERTDGPCSARPYQPPAAPTITPAASAAATRQRTVRELPAAGAAAAEITGLELGAAGCAVAAFAVGNTETGRTAGAGGRRLTPERPACDCAASSGRQPFRARQLSTSSTQS